VIGRLTSAVARLLNGAGLLLPPERRHWAEAVHTEASQVPIGWPRLNWLAGGVWLVVRQAGMARKVGYWIGMAAIAAAGAWVVWQSWRTDPSADPESATDRARVLAGVLALAVLPWVGRRSGWFGPVGTSVVTRFVRVAGCAAICAMGLSLIHLDRHAGINGVLGSGKFNWLREVGGLVVLVGAVAAPLFISARQRRTQRQEIGALAADPASTPTPSAAPQPQAESEDIAALTADPASTPTPSAAPQPQAESEGIWALAAVPGVAALFIIPIQTLIVGCVALVLVATSQRSPVTPRTWTAGLVAGLPAALAGSTIPFGFENLYSLLFVLVLVMILAGGLAGLMAARLVTGNGDEPKEALHAERMRQGKLAGVVAGAIGGLVPTSIFLFLGGLLVLGPLFGLIGGAVGASIMADRRDRSLSAGVFVSSS
jgi:hypothetical protein